ncbi:MAG: bifunctional 4-hydroxy-2-oxoglutarate aldolase/2-dehydro-3-deoxy-phosphogluconate aldolase [Candidatus Krumholzibacteriia bacterium]
MHSDSVGQERGGDQRRDENRVRDLAETTWGEVRRERAILCLRFTSGERLVESARAAARGGLRVVELTLTTPGALEAMAELSKAHGQDRQNPGHQGELLVGGGTVLTRDDVEAVAAAGGRFALSPVFDPDVIAAARECGLLAIPGAATPTEIHAAWRSGARAVKVFPSGALGGPAFLRAVRGPLPQVPLIPTSGPTAATAADYLAAGAVAVGVGGVEFFPSGFTQEHVEDAARRVRVAIDAAVSSMPTI